MPARRGRSGLRAVAQRAARPGLAVLAVLGFVGAAAAGAPRAVAAWAPSVATPTIQLAGPPTAGVGQVASFQVLARVESGSVGAYEATLRYDSSALAVVRVRAPRALPGAGTFTALSAVETPNR